MSEKIEAKVGEANYLTLAEADAQERDEIAKMTPEQFEQAQLEVEAFKLFNDGGAIGDIIKFAPLELEAA